MRVTRHRRHAAHYEIVVQPDPADTTTVSFEWSPDPPEGVSRTDYERGMIREAVLLVREQRRAKRAGTKLAAEGTDIAAE